MKQETQPFWLQTVCCLLLSTVYGPSDAQIASDMTLPVPTVVDRVGDTFNIIGGTRPDNGPNLFHSFDTFSIGAAETANFLNDTGFETTNILGRVTGGLRSDIHGAIQTTGFDGVNLFLLNPAGVMFGPSAQLNVAGSFHVGTVDYIQMADGGRFGADVTDPVNTLLTVAPPAAFGFLDGDPAPLFIEESQLVVPEGETLSLVAGDIDITGGPAGFLFAQSGQINIISVASSGEAAFDETGINLDAFDQLGDLRISQDGFVRASESIGFNGAGTIFIRAGNFVLENSTIVSSTFDGDGGVVDIGASGNFTMTGGLVSSVTNGPGFSPDIHINVTGDLLLSEDSKIQSSVEGSGGGGDITLAVGNLVITDSRILSETSASGDAGDVTVAASDSISLTGDFLTRISSDSFAIFDFGNAGDISVSAETLVLEGAWISSEAVFSFGEAGDISIDVVDLDMTQGALITSGSSGVGDGGDLIVNASGNVALSGSSTALKSTTNFLGDAGSIGLVTPHLSLMDGALIQTATFGDGAAGDIVIDVDQLRLSSSQINSDASFLSSGQAGNITIDASHSIVMTNDAAGAGFRPRITSTTLGSGDAGAIQVLTPELTVDDGVIETNTISGDGDSGLIDIDTDRLVLANGGSISSTLGVATSGDGGEIKIDATDSISITGANAEGFLSNISTFTSGEGDAGAINITAPDVAIDFGVIEANSDATGSAGTVTLTVDNLTLTGGGTLQARTLDAGSGGHLEVNAVSILITGRDEFDGSPSGFFSRTENEAIENAGQGGDIDVHANRIVMHDGATISASSTSEGFAGNINIEARDFLDMSRDSQIITSSSISGGGDIIVNANERVYLLDSAISASAGGDQLGDDGGNVTIDPTFVILNDSLIQANANAGDGGAINLFADHFVIDALSQITATSDTGNDGEIVLETPNNDISGVVADLNVPFLDISDLLSQRCAAAVLRERSSFTVEEQYLLRLPPSGYSPSPLLKSLQTDGAALEKRGGVASTTQAGATESVLRMPAQGMDCF